MNIIKKAGCRAFQISMYFAEFCMPWRKAEITKGAGSYLKLPDLLLKKNYKQVLIVTDKTISDLYLPALKKVLNDKGVGFVLFDGVVPNPTIQNIEDGYKLYKDNKCQAIVAIGGGSPMDCAKIIAAKVVRPNKKPARFKGIMQVIKPIPEFFAIPTTSGTGSEVTLCAVISDPAAGTKFPCSDPTLLPHNVIFDEQLTVTLTPELTATTGMDALTHAVEAYIGKSNTKQTKADAIKAVKMVFDNVYPAYSEPENLVARANMQEASMYAGRAFTRAYVGYVHAVGHACGATMGMPHGLAMSVILPNMLDEYGSSAYKKLAELADVVGITGKSIEEKAKAFIKAIKDLNAKMGIPAKVGGQYKMTDELVKTIAYKANKEANPMYPVPKEFDYKDLLGVVDRLREK